jgi:hypothetical protein
VPRSVPDVQGLWPQPWLWSSAPVVVVSPLGCRRSVSTVRSWSSCFQASNQLLFEGCAVQVVAVFTAMVMGVAGASSAGAGVAGPLRCRPPLPVVMLLSTRWVSAGLPPVTAKVADLGFASCRSRRRCQWPSSCQRYSGSWNQSHRKLCMPCRQGNGLRYLRSRVGALRRPSQR